ncbi:TonB-dependent receptor [Olivibacter sp. SDN3]|uniref:TonB-dependent receptor n=1 Tax=Olivibacter sp. SDN3 TaxID=2764720 RepID=UPI0016516FF5|nr:TonB-dependent receptor [Olivibacter sp. SDN3]QNL50926.1 TonB-dependent receptor [Olivibacter sp. SDN3]
MKKLLIISLLLIISSANAQNVSGITIRGTVRNRSDEPISGISVWIKGTKIGAKTEIDGKYEISGLKEGDYTLVLSAVGVQQQERAIRLVGRNDVIEDFYVDATNEQLEEVIVSSHKKQYKVDTLSPDLRLNTPLIEVPQNIQVITAKTLADQQVISMSDGVLRNFSGAIRKEHWSDLYTNVNARGSRLAAFRNGMNVTGSWGPLTEDMSFVEAIEIVKGPSGFMMSNGEPSGIYNVVTKKPTGRDFNGEATFNLGSFDLYRTTLDLDGKINDSGKLLYRLNLMGQTKNSFRAYEYSDRYSIAPVLMYKVNDQTTLTAEYTYQHAKMSDVGSAYVFGHNGYASLPREFTMADPGLPPTIINDHSAFVTLDHQIDRNWKLTAKGAYFNYYQKGTSLWPDEVNEDGTILRSVGVWEAASEYRFGQVYLNGDVTTGKVRHRILGGLDLGTKHYIADWGQSHALDSAGEGLFNVNAPVYGAPVNGYPNFDYDTPLQSRGTGGMIDQSYSGIYVQDELGFFENRIRLTLAGRYTYVKQSSYGAEPITEKKFTPRFGLSATIAKATTAYALYDQTFIPQAARMRSGDAPKPITGNNMELGLKRDWLDGKINTTLSAYRILKNNTLTQDPNNNPNESFVIDIGQTRTDGIEFDVRGELVEGFNVILNYAYTNSEISKASETAPIQSQVGTKVPGYAQQVANAWLGYEIQRGPLKGIGISGGFEYQVDRRTWSWDGAEGVIPLPDYFKLDGGIFWTKNNIRVTANVYNILDEYLYLGTPYLDYYYWQAEAPRNYRLGVAYSF